MKDLSPKDRLNRCFERRNCADERRPCREAIYGEIGSEMFGDSPLRVRYINSKILYLILN